MRIQMTQLPGPGEKTDIPDVLIDCSQDWAELWENQQ